MLQKDLLNFSFCFSSKAMAYSVDTKISAELACFEFIVEPGNYSGNRSKNWIDIIDDSRHWIEGVAVPSVGIIGLIGNFLVVAVLLRLIHNTESISESNFDMTLIGLAIIDFTLLLVYMTDSFIQNHYSPHISSDVLIEPVWYQVSFKIVTKITQTTFLTDWQTIIYL